MLFTVSCLMFIVTLFPAIDRLTTNSAVVLQLVSDDITLGFFYLVWESPETNIVHHVMLALNLFLEWILRGQSIELLLAELAPISQHGSRVGNSSRFCFHWFQRRLYLLSP